jgi:hypothetical protein
MREKLPEPGGGGGQAAFRRYAVGGAMLRQRHDNDLADEPDDGFRPGLTRMVFEATRRSPPAD